MQFMQNITNFLKALNKLRRTCNQQLGGARGLSSAVGGSHRKSSAVRGGHGGDPQNSAAIAERDLSAGQSGSSKNLAITEPAHLRNWSTCRQENLLNNGSGSGARGNINYYQWIINN